VIAAFVKDFRQAGRALVRRPGLSLAAILTLALGLGANSAVFRIVGSILLDALDFREPEGLVMVWDGLPARGLERRPVTPARFRALAGEESLFEGAAALARVRLSLLPPDGSDGGGAEEVQVGRVTPGFFPLLGLPMLHGRSFSAEEGLPGEARVVVLGEGLWRQRFGGDPEVLGESVRLGGEVWTVVGIAASDREPFREIAAWMPLALDSWESRVAHFLEVFARKRSGITAEGVERGLAALGESLAEDFPETDGAWAFRPISLREEVVAEVAGGLWMLWAAVGLVVLIACGNVAAILLARGLARREEIALRLTLGASRLEAGRSLVAESLLLAFAGGALGLLLSTWMARGLVALAPVSLPGGGLGGIDGRLLAYAGASILLVGLLGAAAAVAETRRVDLGQVARQGGSRGGEGRRDRLGFDLLILAEIALCFPLLVGSGLFLKSFDRLLDVDLGFRAEGVLSFRISPSRRSYPSPRDWDGLYRQIFSEIRALPGVERAGAVSQLPLSGTDSAFRFLIEGAPEPTSGEQPTAEYRVVDPDYFPTLGIPLVRGRPLADLPPGSPEPPGVVINRAMARRYWPDGDPLGQRISLEGPEGPWLPIVGVVGDVHHRGPGEPVRPEFYRVLGSDPWPSMVFVVRTGLDPEDLLPGIRAAVARVDGGLPVGEANPISRLLAASLAQPRFLAVVLSAFATLALLLAATGLAGTVGYAALRRTREIGIRMSLGANRGSIVRLLLGRAAVLLALGLGLGLGAALALGWLMSRLLFEVRATDPRTFTLAALVLAVAVLGAAAVPAIRASLSPPAETFRS